MDKAGSKRGPGAIPRIRLASNNSTPTNGTSRGTSTPSGSAKRNRSCNFSPITNPDLAKTTPTERLEPKLLKPLGPSFPHSASGEKKSSSLKTKSTEDQISLHYMAYQQQHFLNEMIKNIKSEVMRDCQKQLEDLWTLVKMKESRVNALKEKTKIVKCHSEYIALIKELEPNLEKTKDILKSVTPLAKELADGLDEFRHQIRLDDINQFKNDEMAELVDVFENISKLSEQIQVDKLNQVIQAASAIPELDNATSSEINILEDCQQMASRTIMRLGQEITLSEDNMHYKKLSDFDVNKI